MYGEIYKKCEEVALKFQNLPETVQKRINYDNLIENTKYTLKLIEIENWENIFEEYCLLRKYVWHMQNREIMTVIGGFWAFIQINSRILIPEMHTIEKMFKRRKTAGDFYKGMHFLMMARYNMYVPLNCVDLNNFKQEDILIAIEEMERIIDGL